MASVALCVQRFWQVTLGWGYTWTYTRANIVTTVRSVRRDLCPLPLWKVTWPDIPVSKSTAVLSATKSSDTSTATGSILRLSITCRLNRNELLRDRVTESGPDLFWIYQSINQSVNQSINQSVCYLWNRFLVCDAVKWLCNGKGALLYLIARELFIHLDYVCLSRI